MTGEQIRHIIQLYFGHHFSRYSQLLFGKWLQLHRQEKVVDETFEQLWNDSSECLQQMTFQDWIQLKKQLLPEKKRFSFSTYMKYVAVAAVLIVTISVFYRLYFHPYTNVEMAELFVPYGENQSVQLVDGTEVYLKAGSLLVYPKIFEKSRTRTIYLSGEASFKVAKNEKQPFIVKTTYTTIEALGTTFTVEAYPNEQQTKASLEEGSIRVDIKGNESVSQILVPDQQLIYSHQDDQVTIKNIDASLYQKGRKGYLIFSDVTFGELVRSLERRYSVTVQCNIDDYQGTTYNVKFAPDETIEDILHILEKLTGIDSQIEGNTVYIK